jgi:hypothetical protein
MKPWRDSKYLRWIRTLPCVVCGSTRYIEAAHTGPHGISQKSPDSSAIPLCIIHHRTANDSYHKLGPRRFAAVHSLDIGEIVLALSAKPRIRIVAGGFVGMLNSDRYELGPTRGGLYQAIRKMSAIRHSAGQHSCLAAASARTGSLGHYG